MKNKRSAVGSGTSAIFEFEDYRSYLVQALGGANTRTGKRQAAAKAIGCHTTYISQILMERAHISLEQASGLNDFLGHTTEEGHYFFLLVQENRAGNRKVREYFSQQRREILDRRSAVTGRVTKTAAIDEKDETQFYSTWLYGALHVLPSIPRLQSRKAIAEYLGEPIHRVSEALDFLVKLGLIEEKQGRYEMGSSHVHLGRNSFNVTKHHTNWRLKAISSLERRSENDLHYSAVYTLSEKDVLRIREALLKVLEENLAIVRDSPAETAFVYNFDFFALAGR